MVQRYASVSREPPAGIHARYVHSGSSHFAYFTHHRPISDIKRVDCPAWNAWRYGFKGFKNFKGTSEGFKTPKEVSLTVLFLPSSVLIFNSQPSTSSATSLETSLLVRAY